MNLKNIGAIIILGITDAYLISHPNLIGKLGVFIFKYSMIKTFPSALITVFITLGICSGITYLIEKNGAKTWAKYLLWTCTVLSLFILAQVIYKFSSGAYARTGKPFVWGLILLPTLMLYLFGTAWFTSKATETNTPEKEEL
ncbi:hypothetical protein [Arcticibacterium luteifluviistationis]|uniref:Uncharacterized protein n=1 Tax=Arcticibacterium luteifluviistationis TaxID=1784714 RepID=A0A2Z4GI39_9BACT|nr:hypothetical protein [Arcticibacterium luteifluviistationis]AWW00454.1 hypothetical protein DJ013_20645 [Arcticibacterium luteifluviistationis]